jgi:hypothetical protein
VKQRRAAFDAPGPDQEVDHVAHGDPAPAQKAKIASSDIIGCAQRNEAILVSLAPQRCALHSRLIITSPLSDFAWWVESCLAAFESDNRKRSES